MLFGNPPYIKYKSLKENDREYIKQNFITCKKGKFDYCYAFIEKSVKSLKSNGKMAYLIPSSIFKNVFAQDLRDFLLPHIVEIHDYTSKRLFTKKNNDDDRLTSSSIMIINKNSQVDKLSYYDIVKKETRIILKTELKEKWIFEELEENKNDMKRFGDFFKVSNAIATLRNEVFVIGEYTKSDNYIITNTNERVEKSILKDTASPRGINKNKKEKIIFPYKIKNDKIIKYSEEIFQEKYPNAYIYLKNRYQKLINRDTDKNASWFEYGRSQALESINYDKLLISTIITNKINVNFMKKGTIPYSGLYIISKSNKTLEDCKKILESQEFLKYIKKIGINASGESIRITGKDISNYKCIIV